MGCHCDIPILYNLLSLTVVSEGTSLILLLEHAREVSDPLLLPRCSNGASCLLGMLRSRNEASNSSFLSLYINPISFKLRSSKPSISFFKSVCTAFKVLICQSVKHG